MEPELLAGWLHDLTARALSLTVHAAACWWGRGGGVGQVELLVRMSCMPRPRGLALTCPLLIFVQEG